MSNFKTHSSFNLTLALPVFCGLLTTTFSPAIPLLAVFAGTFTYSTLFMSPDMDLAGNIKLCSFRGILTIPFRSYSLFFRHRGLSHSVLLGTLTRMFWLFGFISLVFYLVVKTIPNTKPIWHYYVYHRDYFIWGGAGVFLADMSHLLLDRRL